MTKQKQSGQPDRPSQPPAPSPLNAAIAATMPVVYSAQIAHMQRISGPLPEPSLLAEYDKIQPGLANRIVVLAEDEAAHRRTIEAEVIAIQGRDQKAYRLAELIGQFCGLAIGLAAIFGAVYAAIHGAQIAAAFIGTTGVTGLVTAFIVGRNMLLKQREQDLQQQQAAMHVTQPDAEAAKKTAPAHE